MHRDFLPTAAKLCGALTLTLSLAACGTDALSDNASGSNASATTSKQGRDAMPFVVMGHSASTP